MALPRMRQLVLAAPGVAPVASTIERHLGLRAPYHDPAVGHFGLENAVYAAGDTFVEVVAPVVPETAVGRFLDRNDGPGGYMLMFEVTEAEATRRRLAALGVRIVWDHAQPDVVDLHLHPKDVGGAIVALDVVDPPGSWRWGGADWTAAVPEHGTGGLREVTVAVTDPAAVCYRWAEVLGVTPDPDGRTLVLDDGEQHVRFVGGDEHGGIVAALVAVPAPATSVTVAGVTVTTVTVEAT